jgi:iron complex transport system permease protein
MSQRPAATAALLGLLVAAVAGGLLLGAVPISPADVWGSLWTPAGDPATRTIIRSIRLPRVIAGLLTGASLGVSGVMFQALLRNPLAEPYLLGVSSGAAFGAVVALTILGGAAGPVPLAGFALAGALIAIGIGFRAARVVGTVDTRVLILAGVVVSAFFGAGVMLLMALARAEEVRSAVLWTMGSLEGIAWPAIWLLTATTAGSLAIGSGLARHLNALALGEDAAAHLGTNVELVKRTTYLAASA